MTTTTQRSYEKVLESIRGSTFEAALEKMDPEERVRAQRLRDVFELRDDDALWIYCGLFKGMEAMHHETLQNCMTAMQDALRQHLPGQIADQLGNRSPNGQGPTGPRGKRSFFDAVPAIVLGSLFVTSIILIGSVTLTLSSLTLHGEVPWVPRSATSGAFQYVLTAIFNAPAGGFFAVVGLLGFGILLAISRWLSASAR